VIPLSLENKNSKIGKVVKSGLTVNVPKDINFYIHRICKYFRKKKWHSFFSDLRYIGYCIFIFYLSGKWSLCKCLFKLCTIGNIIKIVK